MKLVFVSRERYRQLVNNPARLSERLADHDGSLALYQEDLFILPEGGAGEPAVKGCMEIVQDIPIDFSFICCACGTGTTLAGISAALKHGQKAIGIPVLHGESFLQKDMLNMNGGLANFELLFDYHFGGYARTNSELETFCTAFVKKHGIPLEPVYTGKLFYGIMDLIKRNYFLPSSSVILVHTGGILQDL
jgi:1-aminocyclopropane-1-carboxylate deaminase/D-cysteine desulfhydrase-like pyridoxal-dependent ACC family enzyme